MTAPISGFQPAELLQAPSYFFIEISGTDAVGVEIAQALDAAAAAGLITASSSVVTVVNGVVGRTVSITSPAGVVTSCGNGDFLVLVTNESGAITQITLYDGAGSTFANPLFSATLTANVPLVWGATTTAPIAATSGSGGATISVPVPTSPNGPFTYTAQVVDSTAGTTTAATLVGEPAIALNAQVGGVSTATLTVTDLTPGDTVSFIVDVVDNFSTTPTASLPSNSIQILSA